MPTENIYKFIKEKQSWIQKKQSFIKTTLSENKEITEYKQLFYLGKKYPIVLVKGLDKAMIFSDHIALPYTSSLTTLKHNLKVFLIESTEKNILPKIYSYARKIGVKPNEIKVINSKAKWGMCDNKSNIYINYKLAMLSVEIIEYVIVHELCHIKQLNHSKQFWKEVSFYLPNYKNAVQILKKADFLIKLF